MKRNSIVISVLLALVSCQEIVIENKADGLISVSLENSPVVEVVTKAETADQGNGSSTTTQEEVDVDEFNVYVTSDALGFQPQTLKYGQMNKMMAVNVGDYTIYADNVSEAASLAGWGEVRYACDPMTKTVESGKAAVFELKCAMVNTAVSVQFMGNFATYLKDYNVSVWTEDATSRVCTFNAENVSAATPAVGYFKPSAYLAYKFTGKDTSDQPLAEIAGRMEIRKATHLTLRFKVKGDESGNLNVPKIEVDYTCEELSVDVEVDPTEKQN